MFLPVLDILPPEQEVKSWHHYRSPTNITETLKALNQLSELRIPPEHIKVVGMGQSSYIYFYK